MSALTESSAWQQLKKHRAALKATRLAALFAADPERLAHYEHSLKGLSLNFAFNFVTKETLDLLTALAKQQKIEERRDQMFRGEALNTTENRPALHTALRQTEGSPPSLKGQNVAENIEATRQKMAAFAGDVRDGRWKGATGKTIKHVVNIGIGGSDLGPRLAVEALASFASGPEVHFVANADAFDLLSVIKKLDPAETLFIVVSKTFMTEETLLNAKSAREWVVSALGEKAVLQHFIAVSTNQTAIEAFGISPSNSFPLWDWVGGRFSLWSAVGLSIMLAVGPENFAKLLEGAAAMDDHFHTAPFEKNIPVLLALLGIWHRNFCDARALAILPYSERLRNLPRYLQQLDMESNGKSVSRDGHPMDVETAPVIFGECGTVGQHSFHQWLHQGTDQVPVDFIAIRDDDLNHPEQHLTLLTNMVAQAGAFAFGEAKGQTPQDVYAGNRSSNLILLDRLDPYHLGLLLALYEHKIFVQGAIWNINSFDQPGVELGKKLARSLKGPQSAPGTVEVILGSFLRRIMAISKK